MSTILDGATFALDAPQHTPAVWGEGSRVLWPMGEPLLLVGPPGVGKTTLAQQIVLARCGVADLDVLGMMVTPDPDRAVMYVAADRPAQARRSLRRMVTERDRSTLATHLLGWAGPLPFSIVADPPRLASWLTEHRVGTVVIDSLKDVAVGLAEDHVGAAVNIALQHVVAEGIEVASLHHQRKAQEANRKPRSLDDVYGSTWLTAGAGSVVLLWGEPGDEAVELRHLKPPQTRSDRSASITITELGARRLPSRQHPSRHDRDRSVKW